MITYIQLNDLGYLDVKDEVAVPLNFSIAEIQDISKRQGNYSKTINLPGTSNNNNLLGHLFDVNIADASFNINIKQKCQVIQNGVSVFDGFLQLLNVNKKSPSQGNPDEFVEYQVQITSGAGDFFSKMGEDLLETLPYWEQYNHTYSLSAITATSAHTVNDGYTYILPWTSDSLYRFNDFTPSIYAKAYWDRIFLEAGYTYEWASLEDCSFDKLIIPYNGDIQKQNLSEFYVRAGFTGSTSATTITLGDASSLSNVFRTVTRQMIFNDDITLPNIDSGAAYDNITSIYTSNYNGTSEVSVNYTYRLTLNIPVDCKFLTNPGPGTKLEIQLKQIITQNTADNIIPFDSWVLLPETSFIPFDFDAGTIVFSGTQTSNLSQILELTIGDTLKTSFRAITKSEGLWLNDSGFGNLPEADRPFFTFEYVINPTASNFDSNNYFIQNPQNILNLGQPVIVQSFIPKQIKRRDFVRSIVNMFNLYITPDKYEDNHLIIQTRDEYYDNGETIDWTDKFSIDSDANIQFLPELQDKRLILSYKQDGDQWNKQYLADTGEVYGQVQYEFENEFVKNDKKVELIFSPTPIVNNQNGLPVPAIVGGNPKSNIRILYYDGWKEGIWRFRDFGTITRTYLTYPRALHFDNPIKPTIDINFAQPDQFYYSSYETVTDNNLYNKYWSRFINQINSGKMLTGTFLLDENDIHNLDLRSKVWLHDCYWNINRIIDYNPNGNGLTKVELISVDEGLKFAPFNIDRNNTGNTITDAWSVGNYLNNIASVEIAPSKNTYGQAVVNTPVFGLNNVIQSRSQSTLVLGDGNRVNASDSIVIGQNNDVQGNNVFAFGNNITVSGDSQAVFNVPVSATTISATTLFVNGSAEPFTQVWEEGSTGNFSVRAVNDTTTDATNNYAVAEGQDTLASGVASHAEGIDTIAGGLACHAEGNNSRALGTNCHAEGVDTIASGTATHTEGIDTQTGGQATHAQGNGSVALGFATHAGGIKSNARFDGEMTSNGTDIGNAGITQFGIVNTRETTTDATPTLVDFTSLGVNQGGFSPPLAIVGANDIGMSFTYQIVCFRASSGIARIITGEGLIKWISGTPTLVFASTPSVNGDIGLLGVTATPVADTFGLKFQVTGLAGATLTWAIRMDYNY